MDYIEFHLSRTTAERIVWIILILIAAVFAVLALSIDRPCEDPCSPINSSVAQNSQNRSIPILNPIQEHEAEQPSPQEKTYFVDMENMRFAPKSMVISSGDTVIFTNKEPATAHKLYERKGLFYGPRMVPGESFNFTFNATGNFSVLSIIGKDTGMMVTIEVTE